VPVSLAHRCDPGAGTERRSRPAVVTRVFAVASPSDGAPAQCYDANAMPSDVTPDPVDVSLFSSYAVVQVTDSLPQAIQDFYRLQGRTIAGFRDSVVPGHAHGICPLFGHASGSWGESPSVLSGSSPCYPSLLTYKSSWAT
jgi:hypothetical protein